jgi:membrane-associated protein
MIDTVVGWFGPAYSGSVAYLLMAAVIFVDRGAFTGVVVPGELFLALGGIYAGRGKLSIVVVVVVGAVAGILGESLSYWLGRNYGVRITRHLPLANRINKHLDEARDYFRRHGGRTVFIGRYVSVAGTFMPFVAGMSDMPFTRFLLFDVPAIALWASAVSLLGYYFSSQIQLVDRILSQFGWGLLAVVVVYMVVRNAWKRRERIGEWISQKKPSG